MQMITHGIFQKGSVAHLADGLPGSDGIPSFYTDICTKAAVSGGIATAVADDHSGTHGFIIVNGVHSTAGSGTNRCTFGSSDIHTIVNTPIPRGLIIGQRIHAVGSRYAACYRADPFFRLFWFCHRLGGTGICFSGLGCYGLYIVAGGLLTGRRIFLQLGITGVSVVQKTGYTDGYRTQHQGYVVALAAKVVGKFLFAHFQAPP